MLFHCLPELIDGDSPFDFTMRSVVAAHHGLSKSIQDRSIFTAKRVKQNRQNEVRYTRNADFTDEIAAEFLNRNNTVTREKLVYPELLNPIFF